MKVRILKSFLFTCLFALSLGSVVVCQSAEEAITTAEPTSVQGGHLGGGGGEIGGLVGGRQEGFTSGVLTRNFEWPQTCASQLLQCEHGSRMRENTFEECERDKNHDCPCRDWQDGFSRDLKCQCDERFWRGSECRIPTREFCEAQGLEFEGSFFGRIDERKEREEREERERREHHGGSGGVGGIGSGLMGGLLGGGQGGHHQERREEGRREEERREERFVECKIRHTNWTEHAGIRQARVEIKIDKEKQSALVTVLGQIRKEKEREERKEDGRKDYHNMGHKDHEDHKDHKEKEKEKEKKKEHERKEEEKCSVVRRLITCEFSECSFEENRRDRQEREEREERERREGRNQQQGHHGLLGGGGGLGGRDEKHHEERREEERARFAELVTCRKHKCNICPEKECERFAGLVSEFNQNRRPVVLRVKEEDRKRGQSSAEFEFFLRDNMAVELELFDCQHGSCRARRQEQRKEHHQGGGVGGGAGFLPGIGEGIKGFEGFQGFQGGPLGGMGGYVQAAQDGASQGLPSDPTTVIQAIPTIGQ